MKEKFKEHKKLYIPILIIVVLAICAVVGYTAKVKYDKKQEEIRIERIKTKNNEISKEYKNFNKEEDRAEKLEIVKSFEKEYNQYKKSKNSDNECVKEYENKIKSMKKVFTDEYDTSIKTISDEIGEDINKFNDKDKLSKYIETLNILKETIKNDYENYSVIDKENFDKYNKTVDSNIKSYSDRLESIKKKEKEEAEKKKAEEEAAAKKAAEEAAKAQQQASNGVSNSDNSSSYGSGYVNNSSSSYDYDYNYDNSGNYSNDYSGENNNYSGSSSSNGSNNSNGNYNYKYGSITSDGGTWNFIKDNNTGDYWDANTGEYGGNINDWM